MKRIQQREGWEKLQAGLREGAPAGSAAVQEKKTREKKQRLEAVFESEFLQPGGKDQVALEVPMPQAIVGAAMQMRRENETIESSKQQ